jgi:hypothetical protein
VISSKYCSPFLASPRAHLWLRPWGFSELSESAPSEGSAIILYDGVCNLCNASVRFVLARDHNDFFGERRRENLYEIPITLISNPSRKYTTQLATRRDKSRFAFLIRLNVVFANKYFDVGHATRHKEFLCWTSS